MRSTTIRDRAWRGGDKRRDRGGAWRSGAGRNARTSATGHARLGRSGCTGYEYTKCWRTLCGRRCAGWRESRPSTLPHTIEVEATAVCPPGGTGGSNAVLRGPLLSWLTSSKKGGEWREHCKRTQWAERGIDGIALERACSVCVCACARVRVRGRVRACLCGCARQESRGRVRVCMRAQQAVRAAQAKNRIHP